MSTEKGERGILMLGECRMDERKEDKRVGDVVG